MIKKTIDKFSVILTSNRFWLVVVLLFLGLFYLGFLSDSRMSYALEEKSDKTNEIVKDLSTVPVLSPLDKTDYDRRLLALANIKPAPIIYKTDPKTGKKVAQTPKPVPSLWPTQAVYPNGGAILPFNRIVAYYGNLYSKGMGVLGQYGETEMLSKLGAEVKKWQEADPTTPAIPALHYIVTTAQLHPGADGKYRLRMPSDQIDKVLKMADKINALVFLDIQVGFSTLESEVPILEKYLKMPNVHLGIDPEFSMKTGIRPGKVVGTLDALDINYTIDYLSKIVKDNNLTPKILIVHRYTEDMVTNYQKIKPTPEVQVVMDMDGWGGKAKKINTYQRFVYKEPVQFTGFKLFYKNDVLTAGTTLMTPTEVLGLSPKPIYIQYQ